MKKLFVAFSVVASSIMLASFAHAYPGKRAAFIDDQAKRIIEAMPEAIVGQNIQSKVECQSAPHVGSNTSITWDQYCAYLDRAGKGTDVADESVQNMLSILGDNFQPYYSDGVNWKVAYHAEVSCDLVQSLCILTEY